MARMNEEKLNAVKKEYMEIRVNGAIKKQLALHSEYTEKQAIIAARESVLSDTGLFGKLGECLACSYITGRKVLKVKSQGKPDIKATLNGKRVICEIKTACGNITDAWRAQYIIYCPHFDGSVSAPDAFRVFTREQWLEFINGYNGRGQLIRKGSDGLHIQSFYVSEKVRPGASKPIARYIASWCENLPTLREVFGE